MQGFGGSWLVFVTTQHSPRMSRTLRQGLISWNSPASLHVCMRLREVGNLWLVCCLRMYLWFHRSRISSYQLASTRKEFVTSYSPNMMFKAPNTHEKKIWDFSYLVFCFVFLLVMDGFPSALCSLSARPRPTYGVYGVAPFFVGKKRSKCDDVQKTKESLCCPPFCEFCNFTFQTPLKENSELKVKTKDINLPFISASAHLVILTAKKPGHHFAETCFWIINVILQ